MIFDIGWALFGSLSVIAFYIVEWKIMKVQLKLSELILNYNAMLRLLRKHQPDIFSGQDESEVSGPPASEEVRTGHNTEFPHP